MEGMIIASKPEDRARILQRKKLDEMLLKQAQPIP